MRHQITIVEKQESSVTIKVSIQIPFEKGWIERLKLYIVTPNKKDTYQLNHVKNEQDYAFFETTINLKNAAMYQYYFSFEANGKFQYYKKINITGENSVTKEECWKMSVGFDVPEWAKGASMYHIFVDRYRKGNGTKMEQMPKRTIHQNWNESPVIGPNQNGEWNVDFFGGNLRGIEETLSYIKKLGVDIIYLSPIMRSQSNHRYDTADYKHVDPYAGTNEALKSLCDKAHKKGMKVILDAVFNHTGNDSMYFNQYGTYNTIGAYQGAESPYYTFYKRVYVHEKHDFAYWWGMKNLPECDGNSPEWRNYVFGKNGVIDTWFALGVDGLRLDVADELTDNFIEEIAKAVKRNKPDGFILGEVWKNPMRMGRSYISSANEMHSVMNYFLVDALIRYYKYCDIWKLDNALREILSEYPEETIQTLMNFTSTHDISRALEIFGGDVFQKNGEWAWNLQNDSLEWIKAHHMSRKEYKTSKLVFESYVTALAFLPGIFSIFYGDEVGLEGIGNLANRAPYPWEHRDKELLQFFRNIGKVRKNEVFLKKADMRVMKIEPAQFAYERFDEHNQIVVITSRTHHITNVSLPNEYKNAKLIFSTKGSGKEQLQPYGAIVLKIL